MYAAARRLNYAFVRRCLWLWAKPTVGGAERVSADDVVYVLANRSLTDIVLLDIVAERHGLASPVASLPAFDEARRFFFLNRPAGLWRRNIMLAASPRMRRLEAELVANRDATLSLAPVSIFWGRAANKDRSWLRALFSEGWAASSRVRRLLVLLFNRGDILVQIGEPLPWHDIVRAGRAPRPGDGPASRPGVRAASEDRVTRRTARLLRVKFRNQKVAALGPDLSHRRTLVAQILRSAQVTAVIDTESSGGQRKRLERAVRKAVRVIAADMSYPTVQFLDMVLSWFWHRIYDGVQVYGIDNFATLAETHTLVYAPCHRSHIDYLLLSYVLYHRGFMLPHIAAGDNLDLPLVGGILRRGGAFFMRRSFQGDRVYTAVFSEYLYQVFRRGHSVEYFVEGGRTRTGRLLPARSGMLQMTIDAHRRGVPRPIVFVPVYIGYEKLIEAGSYMDELRGVDKQQESVGGVLRSLKLARQSFGVVRLSFGQPIPLAEFLDECRNEHPARALGARILAQVNACAAINAMNLVALATLSMPRQAIEERALEAQIDLYRNLLARDECHRYRIVGVPADEIVHHVEALGMLDRETPSRLSPAGGGGDILSHDGFTSVLMTWYRNNVLHTLAAPSFIACLLVNRRLGIRRSRIRRIFDAVFPYIENELQIAASSSAQHAVDRWLAHLQALHLVELRGAGFVAPPDPARQFRLRLLANAVMQVLERFYIGLALLSRAGSGVLSRRALLAESRATAERISRLYGLNAPEFADARLFDGFLHGLVENGVVATDEEGCLVFDERIRDIVRAGQGVIAVELRQALEQPVD